jgi:multidrug efflux pump subunit AcrA (membrane-fusion protein)
MTASAQLIVSQAQGAVSLPSAAISRSGGQTTVTVVRGGKDVVQPVVTGIVGDSATQIVSGLTAGEQVAIATATNLGGSAAAGGAAGGLGGATRALGGGGGGGGFGLAGGGGGARRGGG